MGGDILQPRPAPGLGEWLEKKLRESLEGYKRMGEAVLDAIEDLFTPDPGGFPPRTQTLTGSDFMKELQNTPPGERRDFIRQQFANGNVPDFMRTPQVIKVVAKDANGNDCLLTYEVLPNYLCVGTNADHVIIPVDARMAQDLAKEYGYSLPTAQMVDQVYNADGAYKMVAIHPGQDSPAGYAAHDKAIKDQYQKLHGGATGTSYEEHVAANGTPGLMVGHKKDLVLTDRLNDPNFQSWYTEELKGKGVTGAIALYGFYDANGKPIQDQGGRDGMADRLHFHNFVDYSQGARMVSAQVQVTDSDGQKITMSLRDALAHPQYHTLFSSEGVMKSPTSYWDPAEKRPPVTPRSE